MTHELVAWILAGVSLVVVVAQSWEITYWKQRCRATVKPSPQAMPETPGRVVFDNEGGYRIER